ncbi:MAG TPA: sulfur carrier protein ThiS [Solirubrobacteraceae bacterium]|nr:sulfur carrier protein ThiS [Solirubrobacteraceae bacterium]
MTVLVTVNGSEHELEAGATVADLVDALSGVPDGRGVAVAVEGSVVPRGAWSRTLLDPGTRVEVVVAVQGG